MQSRTNSQLITAFTQTKHNFELGEDIRRLAEVKKVIKSRRDQIKDKKQQVVDKNLNESKKLANQYKLMDDHKLTLEEFEDKHKTNLKSGLTQAQAQTRLQKNGLNKLTQKKAVPWPLRLFHQLTSPFAILLWLGAALAFVAYSLAPADPSNLYLGFVIVVINLGTGIMTFYQNMKSESLMESIKNFIPPETIVIRDGEERKIDATKLVVGDIIKVETGKMIPADIRIIQSRDMKVDNSSLTGQTKLLERVPEMTDENPLETKNIAFSSTLNKDGTGKGAVFRTGDKTFIGLTFNLATGETQNEAPLKKQITRFIIRLTIFAVVVGVILFGLGFLVGYPAVLNFIFAIGIIVANVPEGLILEVTIGLTLSAKRLSERKVLCKTLQAVETLGATSCICSDKTGTLTQNKMTAANLWYSGNMYKAANRQKFGQDYHYEYDVKDPGFISLHETAVTCSIANFDRGLPSTRSNEIKGNNKLTDNQKDKRIKDQELAWQEKLKSMLYLDMPTTGDASQSGLIKFFQPICDINKTRQKYPLYVCNKKECILPFNSTNKYSYSINIYETDDSHYCIFTKGAPERIWKLCSGIDVKGNSQPKSPKWESLFNEANQKFGLNGERVLGYAKYHLPKNKYPKGYTFDMEKQNFQFNNQTFVGVLSLSDPPRDSVPFAVLKCRSAGIKVIMVTGDQPVTAASIAKKCNIINDQTVNEIAKRKGITFEEAFGESDAIVIHGDDITKMSFEDEGLPDSQKGKKLQKWLAKGQIVFARTSPAQKLIIVEGCQQANHVVAVTGDGVNDSPAIKKADVGISMGITGTDVAKDSADMILLNDDFGSIIVGVQEGRTIFDNLKKAITYALTSQISQMLPFIGFVILQFPLPVTTVIVLYISIGTDLLPAIAFAYEPGQLDIMTRVPRPKEEHMVSLALMAQAYGFIGWTQFFGAMLCYYLVANDFGFPPASLQFIANVNLYLPEDSDVYNIGSPYLGSTTLKAMYDTNKCEGNSIMVDWIYTVHAKYDLRMAAVSCNLDQAGNVYFSPTIKFGSCNVQQISPYTNRPVCYTTQAIKYSQSAYFYGVVIAQIFNAFVCKTRKLSFITQGINNTFLFFSITTQVLLVLAAAYFQPFNIVFGTRDNIFIHFGIAVLPLAMMQLFIDQTRKYLIRNLKSDEKGKPHWFQRALLW